MTRVDQFSNGRRSWAPRFEFELNKPPTCALRPMIMNNTCPPRFTAAAGTGISRGFFFESSHDLPRRKSFTTILLMSSSLTQYCWIGLAPIVQYSPLLPSKARPVLVSVPVWPIVLSNRLKIIDLVSLYLTNNLILDRPIL